MEYRRKIDALTVDDVIWTLYTSHTVNKGDEEFDGATLFFGNLIWEGLVARYLPERCLRQYRYVQDIPRPVHVIPSEGIDSWSRGNVMSYARTIRNLQWRFNSLWSVWMGI